MQKTQNTQEKKETSDAKKGLIIFFVCTLILGGMLLAGATVAERAYSGRIYNNVHIAGIFVGGNTTIEATEKIQQAVNTFLDNGITTSLYNKTEKIALMPRGATDPDLIYELAEINVGELVQSAYNVGRNESKVKSFFMPLWFAVFGEKNIEPGITFSETKITDAIRAVYPEAESPGTPTDFVVSFEANDEVKVTVVDAVIGSTIDTASALNTLKEDAKDLSLKVLPLQLIERSSLISAKEAETLIEDVKHAIEKAPYALSFTKDGQTYTYEITKKNLAIWIKPIKDAQNNPILSLDTENMTAFLNEIHEDIDVAPQNAKFTVENDRVIEFLPSKDGLIVNDEQLIQTLQNAFKNPKTESGAIEIPIIRKAPEIPIESINTYGIKEILGTGYSSFGGSPSNRRANIKHGAEKLNGLLIPPGETLSLVERLKPFTTADGYLPELVIKGDEIIPEVGGGLCQIGTTTFRAAMNSGLDIVERRNHSLVVSYYNDPSNGNPGTDATIYDSSPDLKIKNNTDHYIMLVTEVDNANSELHFAFWGTSDGRKGSYTPPQVLSWTGYGPTINKETTSLAPGVTRCQNPHAGATTTFDYNIIWSDGTTTTRTFNSSYRSLPQICLVGAASSTPSPSGEIDSSTEPILE